ncbi:hypothetical protein EPYR_03460 [Erwinia pyrifoliae DSM 12163]|nr:hypothetical protein EPYR_03460 [Erwinia pyrifoliae DSM 12163]
MRHIRKVEWMIMTISNKIIAVGHQNYLIFFASMK